MKERDQLNIKEYYKRLGGLPFNVKVYLNLGVILQDPEMPYPLQSQIKDTRYSIFTQLKPEEKEALFDFITWEIKHEKRNL